MGPTKYIPERITQAEFGRRVGVSRAAVRKGVKSGRIKLEEDGKLLLDQALKDWSSNVDVGQQRGDPGEDWRKARTRREIAEANLAELEYQVKLGSMVAIDEVKKAYSSKVTTTRSRILSIGHRIASILVGKQNEREIADIIYHELEDALRSLCDDNPTQED